MVVHDVPSEDFDPGFNIQVLKAHIVVLGMRSQARLYGMSATYLQPQGRQTSLAIHRNSQSVVLAKR